MGSLGLILLGCPAGSDRNQLISWFITYLQDLQPTYIWVIIHLLSIMDIPVGSYTTHISGQIVATKRQQVTWCVSSRYF